MEALSGGNFAVYPDEIVGLIGDNGAGKSTLTKILSGADEPSEGEIRVEGQVVRLTNPHVARYHGIETVEGAATGFRNAHKIGAMKVVAFDTGPAQVQEWQQGIV